MIKLIYLRVFYKKHFLIGISIIDRTFLDFIYFFKSFYPYIIFTMVDESCENVVLYNIVFDIMILPNCKYLLI